MWISKTYVWDEDDKGEGWRLESNPGFDCVMGFGLAHDTMEHFSLDGSLLDEAHAFGTMLWGRVVGCWQGWPDGTRYPYIMAEDAAEFICQQGHTLPLRGAQKPLDDSELEAMVQTLQLEIVRVLPQWAETYNAMYDVEADGPVHASLFCKHVRDGYRKAVRRWGRTMHAYTWADLFSRIDKHPLANRRPDSENDKLVVSVSPRRQRVELRIKPYVDPFDY